MNKPFEITVHAQFTAEVSTQSPASYENQTDQTCSTSSSNLPKTISNTDLAYLAGLFDGEGTMGAIIQRGHGRGQPRSVLTLGMIFLVVNTNLEVLEWCANVVGAGIVVKARNTPANPRRLVCYRYRLDAQKDIAVLLPQLQPYLKIKRPHVDAAMSYLHSRLSRARRAASSEHEIDLFFNIRLASLANQRAVGPWDGIERITYCKKAYTREGFKRLILEGREDSNYHVVEWTPEMDAQVGTDADRRIAERLGLKMAQVQRRRTHLGRMPFGWIDSMKRAEIHRLHQARQPWKQIATAVGVSLSSLQRVLSKPVVEDSDG